VRALVCEQYGPVENLVVREWESPVAGDDEIVFDVRAAGLNFADILSVAGAYQVRTPPPFIPGNEAAGIVTSVGRNVTRFKPGDRIIGALRGGAFAEQSVVGENYALPLPDGLDFAEGAAYSVAYGTSYHALKHCADLRPGDTVLVLGAAGGVGSAAVELAKAMGARVIAAASSDDKLAFAADLGADERINYATTTLKDRIRELTGGAGADVVYDPVGGDLAEQALRATAWHGRYLVVGFASGDIPCLPANLLLLKEASVIGVWYGTWAEKHPRELSRSVGELAALVAAGKVRPRISAAFALEDFAEAFRQLAERRALGKVVLNLA
jgi:NADPH2:quinone reductase